MTDITTSKYTGYVAFQPKQDATATSTKFIGYVVLQPEQDATITSTKYIGYVVYEVPAPSTTSAAMTEVLINSELTEDYKTEIMTEMDNIKFMTERLKK